MIENMKKTVHRSMTLVLIVILALTASSCAENNKDVFLPEQSNGVTGQAIQETTLDTSGPKTDEAPGETSGGGSLGETSGDDNDGEASNGDIGRAYGGDKPGGLQAQTP